MADKEEKKGKKSSSKLILILVVLLVLGGGGAFGYIKFFKAKEKEEKSEKKVAAAPAPQGTPEKLIPMPLNPYLVNLIDPDTRRYLKVRIVLNLSDKKLEQEITEKLPSISDAIIMFLTSKTYDEVISPMGKKKLKTEIQKIINKHLRTGYVTKVYFTEFLVQ